MFIIETLYYILFLLEITYADPIHYGPVQTLYKNPFLDSDSLIEKINLIRDREDVELRKFAIASNKLAADLYPRLIDENEKSMVFCPLSLMKGLGAMLVGSTGITQKELYSLLGFEVAGIPIDTVVPLIIQMILHKLPDSYEKGDTRYTKDQPYIKKFYDVVYMPQTVDFEQLYLNLIQEVFQITFYSANFLEYAQTAVNVLNSGAKTYSDGKIVNVVRSINNRTSALILDAAYIEGKWATPFPSDLTSPRQFHSQGSKPIEVPFMQVTSNFSYTEGEDYQAVFLYYAEEKRAFLPYHIGLLVILPTQQNGLRDLEKKMTPNKIIDVLNKLQPTNVKVLLPKFEIEYFRDFANDIKELGASTMYDGLLHHFSGMNANRDNPIVTGPLHKVHMVVDEGEQKGRAPDIPGDSKQFTADHPFMFSVVDRSIDLLWFLGHIKSF